MEKLTDVKKRIRMLRETVSTAVVIINLKIAIGRKESAVVGRRVGVVKRILLA